MSFTGFLILALILWVLWSYVNQSRRPYATSETPEQPETTGVAVFICHRLTDGKTRQQMEGEWLPARAALVAEHWQTLGARRYIQVPRLNRWNIVFLLVSLSRSWLVAAIGSVMHGLPIPARRAHKDELWDMIEVLEFADQATARAFFQNGGADAFIARAADWASHSQFVPMVTTRAFLRTHFAPEAALTLFCLRGRPEIGRDGMIDYWLNRHRPFVQGLQPVLNYAWYDQHIARGAEELEAAAEACAPGHGAWDGIASIGYPHLRNLVQGVFDPRVQLANLRLVHDETRFLDLPRSALMVGTVTHVLDGSSGPDG